MFSINGRPMQIALPEFIAFDSSTLNKISADFWSDNGVNREKARRFLALLTDRGIHIALTLTHVSEMMRHGNSDLVDSRIKFLRQLKLIAWIRPFSGAWFPGSIVDLITRELDAAVHESAKTWSKIVELVRPRLWETGCGRDMFLNDPAFWSTIREKAQDEIQHESVTASIARTDAAGVTTLKLGKIRQMPRRTSQERVQFSKRFANTMQRQLTDHGEKRLSEHAEISANFTRHAFREVEDLDLSSHDLVAEICKHFGLPVGLAADEMTVGELGELAIWNVRLSEIAHRLRPTAKLSVSEIGLKALPSYYVERALANEQAHADRISGSDFGDSFSAPLGLYTNGVDVDRRTFHHLGHITASCAELRQLNPKWIRTQDYASIVLPE